MGKGKKQIVIYFADWHVGRKAAARGGEVASIPWDLVTYVNHAFWEVQPIEDKEETSFERREKKKKPRTEFTIDSMRPQFDFDNQEESELVPGLPKNHFAQYAAFSKQYPNVNIMISIGGWARCGYFSEMATTKEGRASFIQSCMELLHKYPWLGGIDIDWEYPGCSTAGERMPDPDAGDGDQGCPIWSTPEDDKQNFVFLMSELRAALTEHFGEGKKKLTACAAGAVETVLPLQDWGAVAESLDMINIMTYDLCGVWDGHTGHATSLQGTKKAVDYLKMNGVAEHKLCIGSPLYAIAFLMKEMNVNQVVAAPAELRKATNEEVASMECCAFEEEAVSGYSLVKEGVQWKMDEEFAEEKDGWHLVHDDVEGATYLYNDDEASPYYKWYLSYEDQLSLQAKLDYINNTDLAGMIVWECSQDTVEYDLLTQMAENLLK